MASSTTSPTTSTPATTPHVPTASSVVAAYHHRKAVTAAYHAKRRAAGTTTSSPAKTVTTTVATTANGGDATKIDPDIAAVIARQLPMETYDTFAASFQTDIDRKDVVADRARRTAEYAAAMANGNGTNTTTVVAATGKNASPMPMPAALIALSASLQYQNDGGDHTVIDDTKTAAPSSTSTVQSSTTTPAAANDVKPSEQPSVTASTSSSSTDTMTTTTIAPHLQQPLPSSVIAASSIPFPDLFTPLPAEVAPPSEHDIDAMLPLATNHHPSVPRFASPPFPGVAHTDDTNDGATSLASTANSDAPSATEPTVVTKKVEEDDDDDDNEEIAPTSLPSSMISLPLSLLADIGIAAEPAKVPEPATSTPASSSTSSAPSPSSSSNETKAPFSSSNGGPSSGNNRSIGDLRKRFETIQMIEEMRRREAAEAAPGTTPDTPAAENNDVITLRELTDEEKRAEMTTTTSDGDDTNKSTRMSGEDATESEPIPSASSATERKTPLRPATASHSPSTTPSKKTTTTTATANGTSSHGAPLIRDADAKEEIVIDVDSDTWRASSKWSSPASSAAPTTGHRGGGRVGAGTRGWTGPTANGSYIFEEGKRRPKPSTASSTTPAKRSSPSDMVPTLSSNGRNNSSGLSRGDMDNKDVDDDNDDNGEEYDDEAADRDDIWAFERDRKQETDEDVEYWDYRDYDEKGNPIAKDSNTTLAATASPNDTSATATASSSSSSSSSSMFPRGPPRSTDTTISSSSTSSFIVANRTPKKLPNLLRNNDTSSGHLSDDDFDVFDPNPDDDGDDDKDGDGVTVKREPLTSVDADQIDTVALDPRTEATSSMGFLSSDASTVGAKFQLDNFVQASDGNGSDDDDMSSAYVPSAITTPTTATATAEDAPPPRVRRTLPPAKSATSSS